MFNLAVTFIAAALLAPNAAVGQNTTLSPCITNCTTVALPAGGCTDLTDLACICTSTDFLTAAAACITQDCPDQLADATTAQTETCAQYANGTDTGSTSGAGTGSSTSAPGGTTTHPVTSAGSTHPPTSSGSHPATTSTTSTGAGFHTASIASGVTLALFGAAFSLF